MKTFIPMLQTCVLFQKFSDEELTALLGKLEHTLREFPKGTTLAIEGEPCDHIGVVLTGRLELQNLYPSGRAMTVTFLASGHTFGEAILFTPTHRFPITITASEASQVLLIPREALLKGLSENARLLENFLGLLSGKLFMLNRRVRLLSMDSIRQKFCDYLINQYKHQKSKTLRLPVNRQKLSDLLGVQRPSLSREMIHMKEEGLIDYDKEIVTLLDLEGIEAEL